MRGRVTKNKHALENYNGERPIRTMKFNKQKLLFIILMLTFFLVCWTRRTLIAATSTFTSRRFRALWSATLWCRWFDDTSSAASFAIQRRWCARRRRCADLWIRILFCQIFGLFHQVIIEFIGSLHCLCLWRAPTPFSSSTARHVAHKMCVHLIFSRVI